MLKPKIDLAIARSREKIDPGFIEKERVAYDEINQKAGKFIEEVIYLLSNGSEVSDLENLIKKYKQLFSGWLKPEIAKVINFLKKAQANKEKFERIRNLNPMKVIEKLTGRVPLGRIELMYGTLIPTFLIYDEKDYQLLSQEYDNESSFASYIMGADLPFIIINMFPLANAQITVMDVYLHEIQHHINRVISNHSPYSQATEKLSTLKTITNKENFDSVINKEMEVCLEVAQERLKDEILAQFAGNEDPITILKILVGTSRNADSFYSFNQQMLKVFKEWAAHVVKSNGYSEDFIKGLEDVLNFKFYAQYRYLIHASVLNCLKLIRIRGNQNLSK